MCSGLIDIKDKYFKQFLKEVEKYLCKYNGQDILEKISKTKEEGVLGLINLTERIQVKKIGISQCSKSKIRT